MISEGIRLTDDRLREMQGNPEDVYDMIQAGNEPQVDLDKAWDAIRFLMRRFYPDHPLAEFLVAGGFPVGDDLGYGPGQGYLSAEAAKIADLLTRTSSENLRSAFVPDELMNGDVYPQIWNRDPSVDDTTGYVVTEFEKLKAFVADANAAGEALLFWIS